MDISFYPVSSADSGGTTYKYKGTSKHASALRGFGF